MSSPQLLAGLGAAAAIFFSAAGSAISSAHGGIFATKSSSEGIWSYAAIIISGVLAIYGLIVAVIIQGLMNDDLEVTTGYRLLCSGLVVGLGCLSSGYGMSRFLDMYMMKHDPTASSSIPVESANEASNLLGYPAKSLPVTWSFIFSMCFIEAIGLYSLIVALFLCQPR